MCHLLLPWQNLLEPLVHKLFGVSTFCRLSLFFAAGAKTNDIIKKQVHTQHGLVFGCDFGRAINSDVACPVRMLDVTPAIVLLLQTTGAINVAECNF